ncbi:phosphotransferase [Skermania sp. ID1734]|uniref:phosphotransferase n=1 Tax=Skermania sp. ID1734 TaxID=2597516 RepID=UPI00117DE485|nr:phosphotransferase [Skermania sp. ID1734]TSD99932.1 phosphotransferase [Skermania sp. ID1734]
MVATQSRLDLHSAKLAQRRPKDATSARRGQRVECLHGGWGGAVYRHGGTVRRKTGPWTPAVHELLRHLESVGFDGAPRVLGLDSDGREVLTFIDGETCASANGWPEWCRSDANVVRAARLIRRFHDAVESFRPSTELTWRGGRRGLRPGEIIGHNDVSLANLVADSAGRFHSIIDWDNAGPTTRRKDLAYAAWHVVGMHAPEHARYRGWTHQPDIARRLRLFLDAYGLTHRAGFADEICDRIEEAAEQMIAASPDDAASVAPFAELLRSDIEFIRSNREAIELAL